MGGHEPRHLPAASVRRSGCLRVVDRQPGLFARPLRLDRGTRCGYDCRQARCIMLTDKLISVVVACYRDAGNVREMYSRLTSVLPQVTANYEIIFVNDNSPDNAEELLLEIAVQDAHVTVISHSRNFGSQMAFTSGMRQSLGDAVILMDGDLQDPPETIPVLVAEWSKGYDVVYGVREQRRENPLMEGARKLFYRLYR